MSDRLDRFINLMRGVFELDKTDLDFGIYRIINIRQKEIEQNKQSLKACKNLNKRFSKKKIRRPCRPIT